MPGLSAVAPLASRSIVAVNGNKNATTSVMGTTNAYFAAREWELAKGHKFTVTDLRSGKAVCILGETVRQELFGAQDPLGASIRIDKISCEVIGVMTAKGQSTFGQDQDDLVIMPLQGGAAAHRRQYRCQHDLDFGGAGLADRHGAKSRSKS